VSFPTARGGDDESSDNPKVAEPAERSMALRTTQPFFYPFERFRCGKRGDFLSSNPDGTRGMGCVHDLFVITGRIGRVRLPNIRQPDFGPPHRANNKDCFFLPHSDP